MHCAILLKFGRLSQRAEKAKCQSETANRNEPLPAAITKFCVRDISWPLIDISASNSVLWQRMGTQRSRNGQNDKIHCRSNPRTLQIVKSQ